MRWLLVNSDIGQQFEALFALIQSPQTAKRFKHLRFATTEDLARIFQSERPELPEQQDLLGFQSDSKPKPP